MLLFKKPGKKVVCIGWFLSFALLIFLFDQKADSNVVSLRIPLYTLNFHLFLSGSGHTLSECICNQFVVHHCSLFWSFNLKWFEWESQLIWMGISIDLDGNLKWFWWESQMIWMGISNDLNGNLNWFGWKIQMIWMGISNDLDWNLNWFGWEIQLIWISGKKKFSQCF